MREQNTQRESEICLWSQWYLQRKFWAISSCFCPEKAACVFLQKFASRVLDKVLATSCFFQVVSNLQQLYLLFMSFTLIRLSVILCLWWFSAIYVLFIMLDIYPKHYQNSKTYLRLSYVEKRPTNQKPRLQPADILCWPLDTHSVAFIADVIADFDMHCLNSSVCKWNPASVVCCMVWWCSLLRCWKLAE